MRITRISELATAAFVLVAATLVLTASASAASHEKVLTAFDAAHGTYPSAELVFDGAGNLYGTTTLGGTHSLGTVFELQPISGGGWKTIVLHNFSGGKDGRNPYSPLIFDSAGNLYGTTYQGGNSCNCGTVFELSPANGYWKERVIYRFVRGSDGANPHGGLVFDSAGSLYGATSEGGGNADAGTVFELTPNNGNWTETVLYSFADPDKDGRSPMSTLIFDGSGNLYGTTGSGGAYAHGNVFELSPGSGGWTEKVLQNFATGGSYAALVFDNAGNLYGTTLSGGGYGFGVVFELTLSNGSWTSKVIHQFSSVVDGASPSDRLLFAGGNLYGTTSAGGVAHDGVVFELKPASNGKWTETVLHAFTGLWDGASPYAGVILDSAGNLYGTTMDGGHLGQGVVFEITP
jgi:uncharacterized repeat protein (TIGR03803 family)